MNPLNLFRIARAYGLIRQGVDNHALLRSVEYRAKVLDALLAISEVQDMLAGYKTYIVAALMAAVQVGKALGYIDEATADMLMKLLGAGAIGTVAAKINRLAAAK